MPYLILMTKLTS